MNDTRREQLLEQYEDAALELLMDEYAEADGERLWNEFLTAEKNGNVAPIPKDLDLKCKQIIRKSLVKSKRKAVLSRAKHVFSKAAIFLLIFSSISITMVLSVDAFRIPVLNYLLKHDIQFTSLLMGNLQEYDGRENLMINIEDVIPSGFELGSEVASPNGVISYCFVNSANKIISLQILPSNGMLNIDTEDAATQNLQINGHEAIFIDKDGFRIVWLDSENEVAYDLFSDAISYEDFWKLANNLAK